MRTGSNVSLVIWGLALLNVAVSTTYANDGYYTRIGSAGGAYPLRHDAVRMISEKIIVDVYPEPSTIGSMRLRYRFRCLFVFEHNGNNAETVQMGFPVIDTELVSHPSRPQPFDELDPIAAESFSVAVDGLQIPYERVDHLENPEMPVLGYDYVYLFLVDFDPGQRRNIEHTFEQYDVGSVKDPWSTDGPFVLNYILQTGATWRAPIERGVFIINFHLPEDLFVVQGFEPATFTQSSSDSGFSLSLSLADFVPAQDVRVVSDFATQLSASSFEQRVRPWIEHRDLSRVALAAEIVVSNPRLWNQLSADFLRQLFFWAGNYHYFEDQMFGALVGFDLSFFSSYMTLADLAPLRGPYRRTMLEVDEINPMLIPRRSEDEAPEYFAAYNIAAVLSQFAEVSASNGRRWNLDATHAWLELAIRLNPAVIAPLVETDPDLEFYRTNWRDE